MKRRRVKREKREKRERKRRSEEEGMEKGMANDEEVSFDHFLFSSSIKR